SKETTTPKYNPLDTDVRLKDALDAVETQAERDSISGFAVERATTQNFSISNLRSDVRSKNPMPWDPANFGASFSFSKLSKSNPTTEYENSNDYRGSLLYTYNPYFKPAKPFAFVKSKNRNLAFIRDWQLNWLPTSISFNTYISRFYYEQQIRSEVDEMFRLPVSVSKNFLWDRQLNITWSLTKTLNFTFMSNTSARIDEPVGAVNRKLFPDKYREWKDTVMQSILHLGTPWSYNQTATATYTAPFARIPALDFINGSLNYNSTYRWDRGATVDGVDMGNTISNQTTYGADGTLNFENIYNKVPWLKEVNGRFTTSKRNNTRERKARRMERNMALLPDTSITLRHNLRTRKIRVTATDLADPSRKPVRVRTRVIDQNNVEVLDTGSRTLKFTVVEVLKEKRTLLGEIGPY
ncbi:MAG: cell surface protein SprA, partial [Candidatus Amulumruptor sp.]|nr:cell surface protein SprA [Candidatus Amulumruptor sp.]